MWNQLMHVESEEKSLGYTEVSPPPDNFRNVVASNWGEVSERRIGVDFYTSCLSY